MHLLTYYLSVMASRDTYSTWYRNSKNPLLFFDPEWLDCVCQSGHWDVCLSLSPNGQVQGALPYYLCTHRGLKVIKMPKLTPYLGPLLHLPTTPNSYKNERRFRKVCKDLISQLPPVAYYYQLCHPSFVNVLPFLWNNFQQTTRYTFRVSGRTNIQVSYEALDASVKYNIRNAKERLTVQEHEGIMALYKLVQKSFAYKNKTTPFSEIYLQNINNLLTKKGQRKIFLAIDDQGNHHAGIYLALDSTTAYCLIIGNDPNFRRSGAVQFLLWHAISWAKDHQLIFDFEGSMIQSIYHLFQDFNAPLVAYHELSKGKNILLTILGRTMRQQV